MSINTERINTFYSHGNFKWHDFRVNIQSLGGHFIF